MLHTMFGCGAAKVGRGDGRELSQEAAKAVIGCSNGVKGSLLCQVSVIALAEVDRTKGLGTDEAVAADINKEARVAEEVCTKEGTLDLSNEEIPCVVLGTDGECDLAGPVALDGGSIGSNKGTERSGVVPLMRRSRDNTDFGTSINKEPLFGEGVIKEEELVDAGRRRRYWRPALEFSGGFQGQGGVHCLALAP